MALSTGFCWFDVTIGGKPLKERIYMDLFDNVTPKTCHNFRQLCTGNGGAMLEDGKTAMTYKGCTFHRVIEGFMIQGGDFTQHNGTGGVSIYGAKFEDENFDLPCDKAGLLAMANAGPNTNGSQFFITTAPAPHLSGRHVVFGKVVRGMNAVRAVEHTATGANDKPLQDCIIADCGVCDALPSESTATTAAAPYAGCYADYPQDYTTSSSETRGVELLQAAEAIRQAGNDAFRDGAFECAAEVYAKAVRYLKQVDTVSSAPEVREKLIMCHNNAAMCALKLGQFQAARAAASEVLALDEHNAKALFRRGVAALGAKDAASAVEDLTRAQALDRGNAEIAAKLSQAKEMEKARTAKLAKSLQKMFS